jgi:hypothetical protein
MANCDWMAVNILLMVIDILVMEVDILNEVGSFLLVVASILNTDCLGFL